MASAHDKVVSISTTQVINIIICDDILHNYFCYRSGGAYELLRSSGCVKLPSQRTLRDYTHYVQAGNGFSNGVDQMVANAAKIGSCPEREKHVILLLDEMHIRQDLVFDKNTCAMIGFSSLGDINDHLLKFEQSLDSSDPPSPKLAKTMMVFMVRGLFSKLQFPYAQFPCTDLSGELLYQPFWEAVGRLEACGFKVSHTMCLPKISASSCRSLELP